MSAKTIKKCSFCNTRVDQLDDTKGERLLESSFQPGCSVCSNCIQRSVEILKEHHTVVTKQGGTNKIFQPSEIKKHLDQYVIDQEHAKLVIAVAVSDHYKRVKSNLEDKNDVQIEKSNVLLIGPTGVGKTHIARAVAELYQVPFAVGDATSLTEAGYVGDDVESLLARLIQAADGNIEAAQRGILVIDEIDKIRKTSGNVSITRDVGGQGVQQALLKLIEGSVCNVAQGGGRKHPGEKAVQFDTSNVLFICSGAFVGLEENIKDRLGIHEQQLGFQTEQTEKVDESQDLLLQVEPDDIVKFGMIPEFVGRLPVIATLQPLSKIALKRIFSEPKNSLLQQYKLQFKLDGVVLDLTEKAIDEIVDEAFELGTGARALRAITEKLILPYKYRIEEFISTKYCKIDSKMIKTDFPEKKTKKKIPLAL